MAASLFGVKRVSDDHHNVEPQKQEVPAFSRLGRQLEQQNHPVQQKVENRANRQIKVPAVQEGRKGAFDGGEIHQVPDLQIDGYDGTKDRANDGDAKKEAQGRKQESHGFFILRAALGCTSISTGCVL